MRASCAGASVPNICSRRCSNGSGTVAMVRRYYPATEATPVRRRIAPVALVARLRPLAETRRAAEIVHPVGAFPGEVWSVGDAAEVAVGRRAPVDRPLQAEGPDHRRRLEVEQLAHQGADLVVGHDARAKGIDQHGDGVGDADG